MKKEELLKTIDEELLDSLYGFCYARVSDSHEAEELCSDILFALVRSSRGEGQISEPYAYIWRTARSVYADFCARRQTQRAYTCQGDPDELLRQIAAPEEEASKDLRETLKNVLRRIAFLSRAYRDAMVLHYFDGKSISEVAKALHTSEIAVRQRLFEARKQVRKEVENMETIKKPTALEEIEYTIFGTGDPVGNDPREVLDRQLGKHIVWLCREKPRTAKELSEELNVPMSYIEEELRVQCAGENGEYGTLRRLDNGRYALNFMLFDIDETKELWSINDKYIPEIVDSAVRFVHEHEKEYLAFPYINKKPTMELILWKQVNCIADQYRIAVRRILSEKYFKDVSLSDRPFTIYGHRDFKNDTYANAVIGSDGVEVENICGYKRVGILNSYDISQGKMNAHFHCDLNLANNVKMQLAIRAVNGLNVEELSEEEKESAAIAIKEGLLYREGGVLYTKFLVCAEKCDDQIYAVSRQFLNEETQIAEKAAKEISAFIKKHLPTYLHCDYRFVSTIACLPIVSAVTGAFLEKGYISYPENGLGAEGMLMYVEK